MKKRQLFGFSTPVSGVALSVCILVTATIALYWRAIGYEFISLDDGLLVFDNPLIRALAPWSLREIFSSYDPELYIPLTLLSYQIEYAIGGLHPAVFHFTNMILHSMNAVLVFLWLRVLLKSWQPALIAALLFAIHPLQTETVVWIAARKDLLSTLFALACLYSYTNYVDTKSRRSYGLSIAWLLLGVLAKPTPLVLPAILIGIDYLRVRPWRTNLILEKLPHIAIGFAAGLIAMYGKPHLGDNLGLWPTLLLASKALVFYMTKLFLPFELSVMYPQLGPIGLHEPEFLLSMATCLIVLLMLIGCRRSRVLIFGSGFALILIAPSFLNMDKNGAIYYASDRYLYLASVGFFLLAALFLQWALKGKNRRQTGGIAAAGLITVGLWVLTARHMTIWRNTGTLFASAASVTPDFHVPYIILGNYAYDEGSPTEALQFYKIAAEAAPDKPGPQIGIGRAAAKLGDMETARAAFDTALRIEPNSERYFQRGFFYDEHGEYEAAIADYQEAIELRPAHPEARTNLGVLIGMSGDTALEKTLYEQTLEYQPWFVPARLNLAAVLLDLSQPEEAAAQYRLAAQYDTSARPLVLDQVQRKRDSATGTVFDILSALQTELSAL